VTTGPATLPAEGNVVLPESGWKHRKFAAGSVAHGGTSLAQSPRTTQGARRERCSIDDGIDTFTPSSDLALSNVAHATASSTLDLRVLAGTSCGIARNGVWTTYYATKHELESCPTTNMLPSADDSSIDSLDPYGLGNGPLDPMKPLP
jgi:hypothetical protein